MVINLTSASIGLTGNKPVSPIEAFLFLGEGARDLFYGLARQLTITSAYVRGGFAVCLLPRPIT